MPELRPAPGFGGSVRAVSVVAACVWSFALVIGTTPARADDVADVAQLSRAGQQAEALQRADRFLAANPRDPRMRFLRGVILLDQKRSSEAQVVFERLTQDYPELPEPYNNLAVLYAAQGDYTRARVALETVVRINPGYAVGYENLGDVHLKLASQSYAQAQRLGAITPAASSKLVAVMELLAPLPSAPAASAPPP
jgi:predicted Zn-dependent protease